MGAGVHVEYLLRAGELVKHVSLAVMPAIGTLFFSFLDIFSTQPSPRYNQRGPRREGGAQAASQGDIIFTSKKRIMARFHTGETLRFSQHRRNKHASQVPPWRRSGMAAACS